MIFFNPLYVVAEMSTHGGFMPNVAGHPVWIQNPLVQNPLQQQFPMIPQPFLPQPHSAAYAIAQAAQHNSAGGIGPLDQRESRTREIEQSSDKARRLLGRPKSSVISHFSRHTCAMPRVLLLSQSRNPNTGRK